MYSKEEVSQALINYHANRKDAQPTKVAVLAESNCGDNDLMQGGVLAFNLRWIEIFGQDSSDDRPVSGETLLTMLRNTCSDVQSSRRLRR